MGGRASKIKTSIVLGTGEGLLVLDAERLKRLGFWIEGYDIQELLSILRLVDDGSIASFVYCMPCLHLFLCEAWGQEQSVTVEEWGKQIRFTDMMEEVIGTKFALKPSYKNTPGTHLCQEWVCRFIPYARVQRPAMYVRSLFAGRLARTVQICGENQLQLLEAIWELSVELHGPPNRYPWAVVRRAMGGIRNKPAQPVLARVRRMVKELEPRDENLLWLFWHNAGLAADDSDPFAAAQML